MLRVAPDGYLLAGDRLELTHKFLFKVATLGELEVIYAGSNGVKARPLGSLHVKKIARGDRATFEPAHASSASRDAADATGQNASK